MELHDQLESLTTGADPGFGDFERRERRAKRVKNSWGSGALSPPENFEI